MDSCVHVGAPARAGWSVGCTVIAPPWQSGTEKTLRGTRAAGPARSVLSRASSGIAHRTVLRSRTLLGSSQHSSVTLPALLNNYATDVAPWAVMREDIFRPRKGSDVLCEGRLASAIASPARATSPPESWLG